MTKEIDGEEERKLRTRCEKVLFELEMEDGEQDGEMCVRFISCNTCFNYLIFDIIRQLLQKSSESGMDGRVIEKQRRLQEQFVLRTDLK